MILNELQMLALAVSADVSPDFVTPSHQNWAFHFLHQQ